MKNKILIAFALMFLIGISTFVIADVFSNTTTKTDTAKLTALKESVGLSSKTDLTINYGKIICESNECWSFVNYPNLIQTEWRTSKAYCSKTKETFNEETNITTSECETMSDYTNEQLITMRDFWTKARLEGYADKLIADKTKTNEVKVNEGTLTVSDK